MEQHPIFDRFAAVESMASGQHVYDLLGGRTRVAFSRGLTGHAPAEGTAVPGRMPSKNEHYFDWIAVLTAVERAAAAGAGVFRMAELGAGWAPWLVRAALAARQRPAIARLQLMAVEADPTHFGWIAEHFRDNGLDPAAHRVVFGAASDAPGPLRFPRIEDPAETYGASLRFATGDKPTIEVPAVSLEAVLAGFDGPVDLMHVDIQGAEYDILPGAMGRLRQAVKSIMVGTHISTEKHEGLIADFRAAGWRPVFEFARGATSQTPVGPVPFGDGFLLYDNPDLVD
jgi:FkbM family methyltransferase